MPGEPAGKSARQGVAQGGVARVDGRHGSLRQAGKEAAAGDFDFWQFRHVDLGLFAPTK
jgi:hypothetical protein